MVETPQMAGWQICMVYHWAEDSLLQHLNGGSKITGTKLLQCIDGRVKVVGSLVLLGEAEALSFSLASTSTLSL